MLGLALATQEAAPQAPGGYGAFLVESMLILAAVCVLAWLVIRFGLRRLVPGAGPGQGRGVLRVVARVPLEPRRTLYVVEAGGKVLLVGAAEQGPLATLAELDRDAVRAAEAEEPPRRSFAEVLRARLARPAAAPPAPPPHREDGRRDQGAG